MTDDDRNSIAPITPITQKRGRLTIGAPRWAKLVAIAVVFWIGFLISWILFRGSDIGTPASSSAALIAANERLLQMVQWTIATILTLGGALIGLNWYQSERRYQDDRSTVDATLAEVHGLTEGLEERFHTLASALVESLSQHAMQEIRQAALPAYSPMRPPVEHYIRILRDEGQSDVHRLAAIRLILEEAHYLKARGELTGSAAEPFRGVYSEIAARHGGLANQLAEILIIPDRS